MNPKKVHKQLYAQIPSFECIAGCNDCCGVVPFSKWEWKRLREKRITSDLDCPYINGAGRCDIYSKRPLMCRLFGTVDHPKMLCPHGCRPKVLLGNHQADRIMDAYYSIMNRGARTFYYGGYGRPEGKEIIFKKQQK